MQSNTSEMRCSKKSNIPQTNSIQVLIYYRVCWLRVAHGMLFDFRKIYDEREVRMSQNLLLRHLVNHLRQIVNRQFDKKYSYHLRIISRLHRSDPLDEAVNETRLTKRNRILTNLTHRHKLQHQKTLKNQEESHHRKSQMQYSRPLMRWISTTSIRKITCSMLAFYLLWCSRRVLDRVSVTESRPLLN